MNHLSVPKVGQFCLAFTLTIASGFVGLHAQVTADSNTSTIDASGKGLDAEAIQARKTWRETMHAAPAPASGCFHATFPITNWEEVECEAPSAAHSALRSGREETTGNGKDYVAQAPSGHYFSSVLGEFPAGKDVKSEKGVGVALFGNGGVLGANEYTLQVNTDFHYSAACSGYTHCLAWQQYVLSSNYVSLTSGTPIKKTAVFIEYWLINYGKHVKNKNICPKGFLDIGEDSSGPGDDCVQNSPATIVHNGIIPITDLGELALGASAKHGGSDEATAFFGDESYKISVKDSLTDISTVWNQAEFNVVGNAGGSRADFNSGAQLLVEMLLDYGSTKTPTCISPSKIEGTTGETNNLTLGKCVAGGGKSPYIEFVEGD